MSIKVWWYIFYTIAMGIMYACHPDKNKKIDFSAPKFTTSDASELFFKNIRQSYYEKTELKEAKLDVYRIKEGQLTNEYPQLNPTIVVNWRYDEAYLLLEPNIWLQELDSLKIIWEDSIGNKNGYHMFTNGDKSAHYQFATKIYNSIQDRQQMYVLGKNSEKLEFFHKPADRAAFRKTMFDYYRLVDLM